MAAASLLVALPARADDAAQARFHDERARAHYAARRYEEALTEFFLEQRLAPNPRILFNIGLCFERLRRFEQAFLFYTEHQAGDDADETRRRYVADALARLGPTVARVRVVTEPEGAAVYVDDRNHGTYGTTPRILALAPGEHRLFAELAGYRPTEGTVTAVRGQEVALTLTLARIEGRLRVRAPVAGQVAVRDDEGAVVTSGVAPLEVTLAPGAFTVELVAEGHRPWREVVRIAADETHEVTATPEALPVPTSEITVTASVTGAVVELDGEPVGFTPTVLPDVTLGRHRLSVRADGYETWDGSLSVRADSRSWVTASLARPAQTTRSTATWIVGGVGAASAGIWAVLLALAADAHARFEDAYDAGEPSRDLRDQGRTLSFAADVALGVTLTTLGTSVLLYFLTEHTEVQHSRATISRERR
ncbi:MAG: PEGA domain-containing protein [Deltaproteobacteria bacterium]|nr:PEGA domain-containing protein [Deltaproteobacteria bacterium]